MACRRGNCTGTPLCSALGICCLQLQQDCGEGCNGLAVGYSRLQINAAGNLEVCSNVAGVCACEELDAAAIGGIDTLVDNGNGTFTHTSVNGTPVVIDICTLVGQGGCTDTLVDNLNGTYTHTALNGTPVIIDVCAALLLAVCTDVLVDLGTGLMQHTALDGTIQTFCPGIGQILSVNDCVEGGVGADYMLREATLTPLGDGCQTLRLESAPEHTSVCDSVDSTDFLIVAAPPVGTTAGLLPATLVVNNPSTCRDMAMMINFTGYMLFYRSTFLAGNILFDEIYLDPVITVNGVPPTFLPSARNSGIFLNQLDADEFIIDIATQGWSGCATVAPGASLTVAASATLDVVNSNTILQIIPQGCTITIFGSTI